MRQLVILFFVFIINSCNSQKIEDKIIFINIGTVSRDQIATIINKVDSMKPRVVGIDVLFKERKNHNNDTKLVFALHRCQNLVLARSIKNYSEENIEHSYVASPPEFLPRSARFGFITSFSENLDFPVLSKFAVREQVKGSVSYHFAVQIALICDSLKTTRFIKANSKFVDVDFNKRNRDFKVISSSEVLNDGEALGSIKDKIVLIGFLGPGDEDKFATPYSKSPSDKDMYGLEFLAYIIAQILE